MATRIEALANPMCSVSVRLVRTIIINYRDSSCASGSGNYVVGVGWLYSHMVRLIALHGVISQDGDGCHTHTLPSCSDGGNNHFSLEQYNVHGSCGVQDRNVFSVALTAVAL